MATITDFSGWLDQADPETTDEIYDIYTSVRDENDGSFCTVKRNPDGKLFVKTDNTDDKLMIVPNAKELFLSTFWDRYVNDPDLSIEGWYSIRKSMEKDD